jgi:hypothetical protein
MNDARGRPSGLDAIYARRFPDEDAARWRRELWQVLVDDFFSRWIPAEATVLDFGCGRGEFINAVHARRHIESTSARIWTGTWRMAWSSSTPRESPWAGSPKARWT